MIIEQCPHCRTKHVQTKQENFTQFVANAADIKYWHVLRCQNHICRRLILAITDAKHRPESIYPFGTSELAHPAAIPDAVKDDYREASICLSAGCYKASMVMSRRVLQRCLNDQGITKHRLVDAIDEAINTNVIRKAFHDVATEIRQFGNLGAHPDDELAGAANKGNAEMILRFAELLIEDFYAVPAMAAALKGDRGA